MKRSLLFCVSLICNAAESGAITESICQAALLQSFAQGAFDGSITVGDLKPHGGTGIGTFDGRNSGMILPDGVVLQAVLYGEDAGDLFIHQGS